MTIQAATIKVDREQARELYRTYRKHAHYAKPIDREIQRTYQLIAQGRVIIRAIESIKAAGLNEEFKPKLAIARADAEEVFCRIEQNGSGYYSLDSWPRGEFSGNRKDTARTIRFPAGTFSREDGRNVAMYSTSAKLPLIPVHLRPKRALASYHCMWEAEWSPTPPSDPMLLRRIGRADLWLVVACWDLTPVEQAALAARLNG